MEGGGGFVRGKGREGCIYLMRAVVGILWRFGSARTLAYIKLDRHRLMITQKGVLMGNENTAQH